MKIISFIILIYNSENDTKNCLDSLLINFNSENAGIIIWDNDSKDGTKRILDPYKKYDFIKIIFAEKNCGFAEGNNLASKYSDGKYIILLNSDTLSNYEAFEEIIIYLDINPKIGIIVPKYVDEIGLIQKYYGYYSVLPREMGWKFLTSLYLGKKLNSLENGK